MTKVLRRVLDNIDDARVMGVRFLGHHLKRASASSPDSSGLQVTVKGVGTVRLRARSSDARVFRQVFTHGQYDLRRTGQWPGIEARYRQILSAGRQPLIIDAGANVGASVLWFARQFPEAMVVAIEPDPANVALCRENTKHFCVDVMPMAIGAEAGLVELLTEGRESWAVATRRAVDGSVPICTVRQILDRHGDRRQLFIVKIDIEGFESDLFASGTDWVEEAEVIIVEPHDWLLPGQATSQNFQVVMARHDFDLLITGDNLVYVRRASGPESLDNVVSEAAAAQRLGPAVSEQQGGVDRETAQLVRT